MEVINNTDRKRFELQIEDKTAFIEYIRTTDKLFLTHTEVPKELEGQGIGSKMVVHAFNFIKADNLKLVPLCPFVAAYLKRHPEWKNILAEGYSV